MVVISEQSGQRGPNGVVMFGGVRIQPSAQPTVVAGHMVSARPDKVVVDGDTYALPTPALVATRLPITNRHSVQKGQNGDVIGGSSTIMPGSKETIGTHIVPVYNGDVTIDGTLYILPSGAGLIPKASSPDVNIGSVVTLLDGDVISAGGQAATVSGIVISVMSSDQGLLVGTRTIPMPSTLTLGHVLTAAGEAFTAFNGQIQVGGSTLSDGEITTIHAMKVSVGTADMIVGSTTIPLPNLGRQSAAVAITSIDQIFSQADASHVAFGGTTLSLSGSNTMIQGTEVSLSKPGLIIGSSNVAFPTEALTLTTLGHTFTLVDGGEVTIDGTTFSIGGNGTTIDGSMISVGIPGLVIGSTTVSISAPPIALASEAVITDDFTLSRLDSGRELRRPLMERLYRSGSLKLMLDHRPYHFFRL